MKHVLSIMDDLGIRCLAGEHVDLDIARFHEYQDSDEHPVQSIFEYPKPLEDNIPIHEAGPTIPTILRYFMDGSRRTYRIGDIVKDGRYMPLVAGQVGVAVLRRNEDTKRLEPMREFCTVQNVIALPGKLSDEDLSDLKQALDQNEAVRFHVLKYEVKPDRDLVDLGVAVIMKYMQDLEVRAVQELSRRKLIRNDAMLVVDGPLRFKHMKERYFDIVQFRNVLGVSKTFRPSFNVGSGYSRKEVGLFAAQLGLGERTPAFKTVDDDKVIGVWYLRLRPSRFMSNALEGVVKVECLAIDQEEQENGLDGERVNTISAHLLRERNVSPYQTDFRWASHIYPIYLAETYIKSQFMSPLAFKGLF